MTILDSKGSVVSDKWIAEQTSRINDILELFDIKSSEHVPKEEVRPMSFSSLNVLIFFQLLGSYNPTRIRGVCKRGSYARNFDEFGSRR